MPNLDPLHVVVDDLSRICQFSMAVDTRPSLPRDPLHHPGGSTGAQTSTTAVEPTPNRAPRVSVSILDQTLTKVNETEMARVDLSLHFMDPDGDPLTFAATSGDADMVNRCVSTTIETCTL